MGLLRGVARTAVVAGTASAVSGRVQRRQAERFAERDAAIISNRAGAYEQGYAQAAAPPPPPPQPAPAAPAPAAAPPPPAGPPAGAPQADVIAQLKELAELKNQGILTEAEFTAQKAKLLGM